MFTRDDLGIYAETDGPYQKTIDEIVLPFFAREEVRANPFAAIDDALLNSQSELYGVEGMSGLDIHHKRIKSPVLQTCYALLDYRTSFSLQNDDFQMVDRMLVQVNTLLHQHGFSVILHFGPIIEEAELWLSMPRVNGDLDKAHDVLVSVYFMAKVLEVKMSTIPQLLIPTREKRRLGELLQGIREKSQQIDSQRQQRQEIAARERESEVGKVAQFEGAISRAKRKLGLRIEEVSLSLKNENVQKALLSELKELLVSKKPMDSFWSKFNTEALYQQLLSALKIPAYDHSQWFQAFYARNGRGIHWAWNRGASFVSGNVGLELAQLTEALSYAEQYSQSDKLNQTRRSLLNADNFLDELMSSIEQVVFVHEVPILQTSTTVFDNVQPDDDVTQDLIHSFNTALGELQFGKNELLRQKTVCHQWLVQMRAIDKMFKHDELKYVNKQELRLLYKESIAEMYHKVVLVNRQEELTVGQMRMSLFTYHDGLVANIDDGISALQETGHRMNGRSYDEALTLFSLHLDQTKGVLDWILQLFSPTYRKCIKIIEAEVKKDLEGDAIYEAFTKVEKSIVKAKKDTWWWTPVGLKVERLDDILNQTDRFKNVGASSSGSTGNLANLGFFSLAEDLLSEQGHNSIPVLPSAVRV